MATLEVKNLNKSFGGLQVVKDLSFSVGEGEIVSIIGPNGAGKTTTLNILTGVNEPDDGEILLDGESIVGLEPHQVTKRGIGRTFQTLRVFLNMSVIENVMSAAYPHTKSGILATIFRTPGWRAEEAAIRQLGRETGLLRPTAARVPVRPARIQPVICEPAPPGNRAGDGDAAETPAARRAGGGHEPA